MAMCGRHRRLIWRRCWQNGDDAKTKPDHTGVIGRRVWMRDRENDEMELQEILWQKDGICTDIEMYFHSNYKLNYMKSEECTYILFRRGGVITADTYFNSFSIGK